MKSVRKWKLHHEVKQTSWTEKSGFFILNEELHSQGSPLSGKWSLMFRGLNQRKKGEKKYPSAYKKSFCISLSLPPRVKAKVLRHSTVGQNNILCSAHHIPTQAKCLWIFFFSNFKAFWLKYTRRALTEQAVFCSSAEGFNGLRRCSKSIYFKAGMKQTWQMAFKKKKSKGKFLEHILQNKILFLFFFSEQLKWFFRTSDERF